MKAYVTFGQSHAHAIDGKTFDKDCVAIIYCNSKEEGRNKAFEFFGPKFCFIYFDDELGDEFGRAIMKCFPRGFIEVNPN